MAEVSPITSKWPAGTTVEKLFAERVPYGKAHDYLIRVNRQPVTADQVLQEGDRVSFTPTKIEGAGSLIPRRCDRSRGPAGVGWSPSARQALSIV